MDIKHYEIKSDNNWEVDVPVVVDFFIKKDKLEATYAQVKKARPRILFLLSDGPRSGKLFESDYKKVQACRSFVRNIDWNCSVYELFAKKNLGIFKTYYTGMDYVFSVVDRCIFLEEDVVASVSFFRFCAELLEKYKNDTRVHYITGQNYYGEYLEPDGDYFFAGEGSIWGYAIWKRTYDQQTLDFRDNSYAIERMKLVAKQLKPGYEKKIQKYVDNPQWEEPYPTVEFYKNWARFAENQLYIVPTKNMISSIGVGDGSTHSASKMSEIPKGVQRLFFAKTYEYEFPLRHPQYVIRDIKYDDYANSLLAWNQPIKQAYRKMEALVRHLRYRDFDRVRLKFKSLVKK